MTSARQTFVNARPHTHTRAQTFLPFRGMGLKRFKKTTIERKINATRPLVIYPTPAFERKENRQLTA